MAKYPDVSRLVPATAIQRSRGTVSVDGVPRPRTRSSQGFRGLLRAPSGIEGLPQGLERAMGVVQLNEVAEGLMAKIYRLNLILDYPDPDAQVYLEAFWKSGVFPNHPRTCMLLSRKFPEHFGKLQHERVDKAAFDAMREDVELHLQSLEQWIQLLLDLMPTGNKLLGLFWILITLLPHQNSLILHAFMDLSCCFVRANLLSEKAHDLYR